MKKVAFSAKPQAGRQLSPDDWVSTRSSTEENQQRDAEPMKRLTIDVPASLHRRIKVQCAARDSNIADEVRALLEKHFPDPAEAGA